MDRFEHAEPRLTSDENLVIREKGVRLYDGNDKTTFEGGEIVLTSHRLLWGRPGEIPRGLTCLSLPLRYVVFVEEETGSSSFVFNRSKKIVLHLSEALPEMILQTCLKVLSEHLPGGTEESLDNVIQFSRSLRWRSNPVLLCCVVNANISVVLFCDERGQHVVLGITKGKTPGPVNRSIHHHVKLSFKDGLENNFLQIINDTIQSKKWEIFSPAASLSQASNVKLRTGIVGIERGIQEKQKATDESISKAFQDLSKLMDMAKDMVSLSKNISQKIREKQGDITEDETVRFKSYLLSLGIDDPVTRNDFRNENQYYKELARQLADILEQPIMEVGGMMALTDVYCRVNRARGLELLSPEDLIQGCHMLEQLNLPIRLRKFDSGVKVLQLQSHSDANVVKNTALQLEDHGSLTAEELAQALGISVLLAKERLLTAEKHGKACRDESIEGLRFYPNQFLQRGD